MPGKDLTSVATKPSTVHVPLATEAVSAINVEVVAQALYNYCHSLFDGKIVVASGVTMSVDINGAFTCNGKATFPGTGVRDTEIADADIEDADIDDLTVRLAVVNETLELGSTAELECPIGSNVAVLGRSQGRPRVYMADVASATIDTTQADEFVLHDNPSGAPNVIVLRTSTAPLPREDETITLVAHFDAGTGNVLYSIRREDATVICTLRSIGGVLISISAQFRFTSGVWRLGPNSGTSTWWNIVGPAVEYYGVLPTADS